MPDTYWKRLDKKVFSTIRLYLSNGVLQKIHIETMTARLQRKLEALCLSKSIDNQLVLKQWLYTLCLVEGTSIKSHTSEFITVIDNLKTVDVKVEDQDKVILLLCSLLLSYKTFWETIIYRRISLTFDDINDSFLTKEKLDNGFASTMRVNEQDVNLHVRREHNQDTDKGRFGSKRRNMNKAYFHCKKMRCINAKYYKL